MHISPPPKRRVNRSPARLSVRISFRTYKQWRKVLGIGKLLGLRGDRLVARVLRWACIRLQQECHEKGIDWREALRESEPEESGVDYENAAAARQPMIDE